MLLNKRLHLPKLDRYPGFACRVAARKTKSKLLPTQINNQVEISRIRHKLIHESSKPYHKTLEEYERLKKLGAPLDYPVRRIAMHGGIVQVNSRFFECAGVDDFTWVFVFCHLDDPLVMVYAPLSTCLAAHGW